MYVCNVVFFNIKGLVPYAGKAPYTWAKYRLVQQKPADIRSMCAAACPTEAGRMSGFCRSGMTKKHLPIGIQSALSANGCKR